MPKNIVICCDGTGNQFGEANSNVVKLYSVLEKYSPEQVLYYNPGVGTMSDPGLVTSISKKLSILRGLVFGYGLARNIANAYSFIMENYEKDDKLFLFGFSRGAYTVKVLASFIHMNGLLMKGCQNLIPYSWDLFQRKDFNLSFKFRRNYARKIDIHFLGVWDAVSSIGWVTKRKTFPYTFNNPSVKTTRHAVAIDERRAYYEANLFDESSDVKGDVKQVWFSGVHSDVGGSYPENESGLSKITLEWMIKEAQKSGLLIYQPKFDEVVKGIKNPENRDVFVAPNFKDIVHKSLSGAWWLLEILPKNDILNRNKWTIPMGRRRVIPENATIHPTVFQKIEETDYTAHNLPLSYKLWEE